MHSLHTRPRLALMVLMGLSALVPSFAGTARSTPVKPVSKIIPGKVIVPTDHMRRIWGELISIDQKTRTGTFRNESTNEVMSFTVMPYAELYHHAAFGDLQDYRIGTRAIFRLHENDEGKWVWLTYIQDEMNFLFGHKEYYGVDRVEPDRKRVEVTLGNADRNWVRTKGLFLETDAQTRYWKDKAPAHFEDIKPGDRLRTETHGIGKDQHKVCWEVFLDEPSMLVFQAKQQALHGQRMKTEGLPGYVDTNKDGQVELTLFQEGRDEARGLRAGQKVRLAPAGVDRKPSAPPMDGVVTMAKMAGNLGKVTVSAGASTKGLVPGGVARLWVVH